MSSIKERSKGTNSRAPSTASFFAVAKASVGLRAIAIARKPVSANRWTMPRPSPRLPPVTMTLRMGADQLSRFCHREVRHKIDRGWNLVLCQFAAAKLKDLALQHGHVAIGRLWRRLQHHIRHHQSADDRVLLHAHQRDADFGVAIDDRFNLFRMHL